MGSEMINHTPDGLKVANGNNPTSQKSVEAILKDSAPIPKGVPQVSGIEFDDYKDRDITVTDLVSSMENMGFQASEHFLPRDL